MKPTNTDNNQNQPQKWLVPLILTAIAGFVLQFTWKKSGRTLVAIWNWLWGNPIESGGKIAVQVAQDSLESMQQSVAQLTASVATAIAAYEKVKGKYTAKQQEYHQAESQALLAYQNGNEEAAKLAMSRAIAIENLLPKMSEQVAQAEKVVVSLKDKLHRERQNLETYQIELQGMKVYAEINAAVEEMTEAFSSLDINSARNQFESAQAAVEGRYIKANAQAELSEDPAQKWQADLERLTRDDEISRRLKKLQAER